MQDHASIGPEFVAPGFSFYRYDAEQTAGSAPGLFLGAVSAEKRIWPYLAQKGAYFAT